MAITIEMLFAHVPGGPVLDEQDREMESISEFDILTVIEATLVRKARTRTV